MGQRSAHCVCGSEQARLERESLCAIEKRIKPEAPRSPAWRSFSWHKNVRRLANWRYGHDGGGMVLSADCMVEFLGLGKSLTPGPVMPELLNFTQIQRLFLNNCELSGPIPDFLCLPKLKRLDISHNPKLYGRITKDLVLQCDAIQYQGCKKRDEVDNKVMAGPFIVGARMASENIPLLMWFRNELGVAATMLTDPPKKGTSGYEMKKTHGHGWVAWQEVWLNGLRDLQNRTVYALVGFKEFEDKFKQDLDLNEHDRNEHICFDACYELPPGERARNILDWERRQLLQEVAKLDKCLKIEYIGGNMDSFSNSTSIIMKPKWYDDNPTAKDYMDEGKILEHIFHN